MRTWWVNQNQTYRQEIHGGYLWSPKRKANGHRNAFYESMREVSPGDLVFSFAGTLISAFGLAHSFAYEAPKPPEFGEAGRNWNRIGWRVDVRFHELAHPVRPSDWMELLRPLLPSRYSPLRPNGHGVQSIYLTEIPQPLALTIAELVGNEVLLLLRTESVYERPLPAMSPEALLWEDEICRTIDTDRTLESTTREALIVARRGQGLFRQLVQERESFCRITKVDRPEHLRASHCKPWRDCTNEERLDGENGLLLTPSMDHLFDRGFISFRDDGRVLISPVAHRESLAKMGLTVDREANVGGFTHQQQGYLDYHRDQVFPCSQVRRQSS